MTRSEVHDLRKQLWHNGYRPVAVVGKLPVQYEWTTAARENPPFWVAHAPSEQLGTGILCDGLRAIDIDLSDETNANAVIGYCLLRFGNAPVRYRMNAVRALLLYRAAEGEPRKSSVANGDERVEVLGRGQQFVAFGVHPSGAEYEWMDSESPLTTSRDDLMPITEAQVGDLLQYAKQFVGEREPRVRHDAYGTGDGTGDGSVGLGGSLWCIGDIRDALQQIANPVGKIDHDTWLAIGMAVYAASAGSSDGLAAWRAWSCGDTECDKRWRSFSRPNGATKITGATLRYHARQSNTDWLRPSRQPVIIPNVFDRK